MATSMGEVKCALTSQKDGVKPINSLHHGDRKFYRLPQESQPRIGAKKNQIKSDNMDNFMSYIDHNVIGRDTIFYGPFGQRQVVYCDYTASGRSLEMIEDYIRKQVLPLYGNTHTTTTVTSLQTTLFRHEARDIIRNAVNASEHDAVIFVGTGCTAAVHKLIHSLYLQSPPVVFVGPYEHHSNLLPWREIGADVVQIAEDEAGLVDLSSLEDELKLKTNAAI
ncbi:probable cysteine desulfurase [Asterias rubens]|uniref:probable cysteine desulfurase n=1 Tax=Asterias rubens TaxID=7604 RepID=UPI001454FF68|nr:probable cysteine desulfurase [Asterias rubens]